MAMRPDMPSIRVSRRGKIIIGVLVSLFVLLSVLGSLVRVYTNWLWFGEVGYRSVFSTILWTRIVLFLLVGLVMAVIIGANVFLAYRMRPPFRPISQEQENLERYRVALEPRKRLIFVALVVLVFLVAGTSAQGHWKTWQLWRDGVSFGIKDPQFHRDISFFAWDYPFYRLLLGLGFNAVVFSLLLSLAVHYLFGAFRIATPGPKLTISARRHVTLLVFFFIVLKACAYWLDRYGLVFSGRGKVTGASYTDVNASLPAKTILFWVAVLIALAVLASLWLKSAQIPVISFVVLLVLSIGINGIYPAIVQQVTVKPNASDKEAPYISTQHPGDQAGLRHRHRHRRRQRHLPALLGDHPARQRRADRDRPDGVQPAHPGPERGVADLLEVPAAAQPVRLLHQARHRPLPGRRRGPGLRGRGPGAGRQQADRQPDQLDQRAHLLHPRLRLRGGRGQQRRDQHQGVHRGRHPAAGAAEPDHAAGVLRRVAARATPSSGPPGSPREYDGADVKTTYAGSGGVSLSNLFNRLAFGMKYRETNFLLNDAASAKGAKIIFDRNPRQRVEKVAPFLTVDGDPYPAVIDGRVQWIVDAYTTIANYPYSERQSLSDLTTDSLTATNRTVQQADSQINYIRNSVKATVDAYTGKVVLYEWDDDPVLRSWMKVFPGIIQPKSAMPDSVLAHVRYPQDLFEVQRKALEQYHVDNPRDFYNVADKWTVPNDPYLDSRCGPAAVLRAGQRAGQPRRPAAVPADHPDEGQQQHQPGGLHHRQQRPGAGLRQDDRAQGAQQHRHPGSGAAGQHLQLQRHHLQGHLAAGLRRVAGDPRQPADAADRQLLPLRRAAVRAGLRLHRLPDPATGAGGLRRQDRLRRQPRRRAGQPEPWPGRHLADRRQFRRRQTSSPSPSTSPPASSSPSVTPSSPPVTGTQAQLVQQLNTALTELQAAYRSGDFAAIGTAQAKVQRLTEAYLKACSATPGSSAPKPSVSPSPSSSPS